MIQTVNITLTFFLIIAFIIMSIIIALPITLIVLIVKSNKENNERK